MPHAPKRSTQAKYLPARLRPCAWQVLPGSLLLLATTALASGAKKGPWAELQPMPASMPAAKPQPAQPHACQPESFIPGETPYERVDTQGTPAQLYELPTGEQMNINGWEKENEQIRKLPEPFSLTYYVFGCASELSYVLDVSRSGKRYALYQHVLGFDAHQAQPVLFLAQSERKDSSYQSFVGLVDLGSKRKIPLSALPCVSATGAHFSGDSLVTYGRARASKGRTAVCVWGLDGTLKARLLADLDWMAGAGDVLLDRVGVLPQEPGTFYSLHYDRFGKPSRCELRLQSLSQAGQFKRVDLGVVSSPEACASKEAELSTQRLNER